MSEDEAAAIERDFGAGKVYRTRWGEIRTRVRGGRCVFFVDGGCAVHDRTYYPSVCRGFPWVDAETGGPYQYDRTICPEFLSRPELLEVYPPAATSQSAAGASPSPG
ncbi:MAG: hypothetical protein FJ206_10715 [Gemmatimonadetes bacterium]|nr:hypothetical protein [Gemmatimonadota bacterium]